MTIEYNLLNLPSEVTGTVNGTTMTANYKCLPDGTKLSTADNAESGFAYLGSLVYRKDGSSYTFESTDFSGGRIYRDGIGYDAGYFVRGHLGSTRTIVDGSGNIVEQNDYYPFGGRLDNGLSMSATNRYRFSGKEQQTVADVDLLDFGARFYDDEICRWTTIDPLAKKYFGLSPYNYCGNDPVNRFDPDGKVVIINGSEEFRQMYNEMREWLRENNCDELLTQLENNQNVTITIIESTSDAKFIPKYKRGNHLSQGDIKLDFTHFAESNDGTWLSPSTQFMHEVDHATEAYSNFGDFQESQVLSEKYLTAKLKYNNNPFEFKVMLGTETSTAVALGEIPEGTITRTSHSGKKISIPTKCSSVKSMSIMCGRHNALLPMLKTDNEYLMYVSPVIR